MKSFPTSKYKKYKVKYFVDVEWRDKAACYVVIELPTNDVVQIFKFKEDAEEMVLTLMTIRPFGKEPLPKFLKENVW
tara:strand:+ start:1009 stop:1239 length:231 start_codon:yes stop_codon:yes gene_type:complete